MDTYSFVLGLIAAIPPTIVAAITLWQLFNVKDDIHEVHLSLNSRLDQLLARTMTAGVAAGRAQLTAEQANPTSSS